MANLERSRRLFEAVAREDQADVRAQIGLARLYESFGTAAEAGRSVTSAAQAREWYAKSRGAYVALRSRGLLDGRTAAELESVSKKLAALGPG